MHYHHLLEVDKCRSPEGIAYQMRFALPDNFFIRANCCLRYKMPVENHDCIFCIFQQKRKNNPLYPFGNWLCSNGTCT